jgi:hypothetical protein
MSAPVSYTEAQLKTFLVEELDTVATALGLTTSSASITRAVYAVERALGVSDVASLTDMAKLEAIARWQAWLAAEASAISNFDLRSSGDELKLSQILEGIRARLAYVEAIAARYSEVAALVGGGVPVPYAGGLSKSEKRAHRLDTDRVQPFFRRGLHEPYPSSVH